MSLNIKSEETHRLVRELSKITGESQTTAVTRAVQERLDRLNVSDRKARIERAMEIGRDCASRMKEPYKSIDHGDLLYGPDGLPH